jgi:hypothetical protein
MTAVLDLDKLAKVLALAGSNHDGEALAALRKASGMLKAADMTFVDIGERLKGPAAVQFGQAQHSPAGPSFADIADIFAAMDDQIEAREPGWKAKCAAEREAKNRERAAYRKAVLDKYGSKEAVIAPCWREQRLRDSLGPLVVNQDDPCSRWTASIDGNGDFYSFYSSEKISDRVRRAIEGAYELPSTINGAYAEYQEWREREKELDAALNWNTGNTALDLVCYARQECVRALFETEIVASDIHDVLFRSHYISTLEIHCDWVEAAILRDLEHLARSPAVPSRPEPSKSDSVQSGHPQTASERRQTVIDLLSKMDTAGLPDREIARRAGVSPSTVGAMRRKRKV